jgi:hypothetical protein
LRSRSLGLVFLRSDPDDPQFAVERQARNLLLRPNHPLGIQETDGQSLQVAGRTEHGDQLLAIEHDRQRELASRPLHPGPAPLAVDAQHFYIFGVFHDQCPLIIRVPPSP